MKKFYAILSLLFVYIFLVSCGSVFADGDYYDYSNPTTISIGGDGTVIFGDGNTMGQPIEISESDGDTIDIAPEAQRQSVGLVRVDGMGIYAMLTNTSNETQTVMMEIANRTWVFSVSAPGGVIISAETLMEYGDPMALNIYSGPDTVLLERVIVQY